MCQAKSVGVKGAEVNKTGLTAPVCGGDKCYTRKTVPHINFPPLRIFSCCSLCLIHPAMDLSPISAVLDTRLQLGKLRPRPEQRHCPSPGSPYLSNGPTILQPETCTSAFVLCGAVMSHSLQPQGLQSTRLLCPWDSSDKSTGVGCHALLQGIFATQGSNPGLPHCRRILYQLRHQGSL